MSESVRLCKKAKLGSRYGTESTEENLDVQEPAQKKIHLATDKKHSQNNASENISMNPSSSNMDDEDEPVTGGGPSNYMSFLLSLSEVAQEVPEEAVSPEVLCLEQDEYSSEESVPVRRQDKNYEVCIEKTKEILAVLHELYPDEMEVVIQTRNEWGRLFHEKYPYEEQLTPREIQLQDAVAQWKRWSVKGKLDRVTPYCYKCYLCDEAWWTFYDFSTHMKQHGPCKIRMETSDRDFNMVAYRGRASKFKELPIDGKCLKCAQSYEYHVASKKLSDKYYSCLYCYKMFDSCKTLSMHTGTCDSNPVIVDSRKQLILTALCQVCGIILKHSDLSEHLTTCHSVRSDEPIFVPVRRCHMCNVTFNLKENHVCLKKMVSVCCSHCKYKFQSVRMLKSHLKAWNGDFEVGMSNVMCKECKKWMKPCSLGSHYVEHSRNFVMVHQCVACDSVKLFETQEALLKHRNMHHRSFKDVIFVHKIVMAKVMLQQCIIGDIAENGLLKEFKDECEIGDGPASHDGSDDQAGDEANDEVQSISSSSSENDDTDINDGSQLPNTFNNDDIIIMNDDPIQIIEVPAEHVDDDNMVVVKKEDIEIDEDVEQLGDGIEVTTEKDNENDSLIINNEDNLATISTTVDKWAYVPSENECGDVDSNKIENEDKDNAREEGNKNKVVPKLIEELNEFLDLQPDVVGVKEDNASDDEGGLNIVEFETESSISNVETSVDVPVDSEENQATKSLESEVTIEGEKDLIIDIIDSSDDEAPIVIKKKNVLTIVQEDILKAGYLKRKTYRCARCGYTDYHKEYKQHMESGCRFEKRVNDKCIFKCNHCATNFRSFRRYAIHFVKHEYNTFQCPQCRIIFDNANILESHLKSHIKSQFVRIRVITPDDEDSKKKLFKCKDCKRVEESVHDTFVHWESHLVLRSMARKARGVEVGERGQNVLKPEVLNNAIAKLLDDKVKTCCLCSRRFARLHDTKRHLIEHLLEDTTANKVNSHLKCQICSKLYRKPNQYRKHMRDHAGLHIYQCSLCDKSFSDASNFVKHKKVHNLTVFTCGICMRKFQRYESLQKHVKMHSTVAPSRCEFCDKVFQCQTLFKKHRRYHFKKAQRCPMCVETFATSELKDQHLLTVHKIKVRADPPCRDVPPSPPAAPASVTPPAPCSANPPAPSSATPPAPSSATPPDPCPPPADDVPETLIVLD